MHGMLRFVRDPFLAGVLTLVTSIGAATPASAHKGHHATPGASGVAADTVRGAATGDSLSAAPGQPGSASPGRTAAEPPFVMPRVTDALLEHPHNKLVHFPLALALVAALLLVAGRRRPELDVAGRWLVRLAALGGVAAYFTGRLQEEAFDGEPKEWLVHLHENWGLATAIVLVVWALLTFWKPARRHAWLWGLVAAAMVLITAFYGGIVAHGE